MIKTAGIFTDRMVLQQGQPIPVWGTAQPGTEVTVSLDGTLSAMAGITAEGEEIPLTNASVQDGKLVVYTDRKLSELRFAWTDYYKVNLYNEAGLPAKPFRCRL